ncbi:hypothetical protein JCM19239_7294 [Vibrio variabilis]|uniref:Uncharacterized protein n=1 Tax=Vibrio variabilis TaxID=990271 RepID=A0ABQ0J7E3_9VIBR|nr:hypothetical protein JCM19239_7294 [Vibrio variabilis]
MVRVLYCVCELVLCLLVAEVSDWAWINAWLLGESGSS